MNDLSNGAVKTAELEKRLYKITFAGKIKPIVVGEVDKILAESVFGVVERKNDSINLGNGTYLAGKITAITPYKGHQVESLSDRATEIIKASPEVLREKWLPLHTKEGDFIKALKKEMLKLYAGKTIPVERNYIALISRHTDKPICKMDISQSAAGKSKAVDVALMFVSKDGYHKVDSSSPTTIVYNDAQYEHKMIVFGEIDSFPEDGVMASALRALISEGELVHEVTERDENGKFIVRRIHKKGPTGFLSTATRAPKVQMATRTLVSGIDDSKEQTRKVMTRIADDYSGKTHKVTVEPFIAFDKWLTYNRVQVVIPYASILAEVLPNNLVRMRRDITQLYRVIETFALINQPHRSLDDSGKLIASIEDYGYARELLADLFDDISRGGVTPKVRAAVEAVNKLHIDGNLVTTAQVGEEMQIDRTTAHYHCKRAIELEYIENEAKDRKPFKMKPGLPLPEDTSALPTKENLLDLISLIATQPLNIPSKPAYIAPRAEIVANEAPIEGSIVESPVESLSDLTGGKETVLLENVKKVFGTDARIEDIPL